MTTFKKSRILLGRHGPYWSEEVWQRITCDLGFLHYIRQTGKSRISISQNHFLLYGNRFSKRKDDWICVWSGKKADGTKWHHTLLYRSLKKAKTLHDWRKHLVSEGKS